MTDVREQIEWLHKESRRNSRMQGEKRDDGSKLHSCNRRRTLRGRAYQQKQAADSLESLLARNEKLEDAIRGYVDACPMCSTGVDCQDDLCWAYRELLDNEE